MPSYTKEELQRLLGKVISYSKADETMLRFTLSEGGNTRYARNAVTTAGDTSESSLAVTTVFGKKIATVNTNEFDDQSLKRAVKQSEEIARLSPENPEFMSMLPQQAYSEGVNYDTSTAQMGASERAAHVSASISAAASAQLESAGYIEHASRTVAIMNSKGMFAYNRGTEMEFSVTLRNAEGTGSGYASRKFNSAKQLDARSLTQYAAEKARQSAGAREIAPGKYTVILEPLAVENMLSYMVQRFDAREADEGRSFLSRKGGGTRSGEKMFSEKITMYSDPLHPALPSVPFNMDGQRLDKTAWVENGVIKNLSYSRFWAQQKNTEPLPAANNVIFEGGTATLDEMIANTRRGILVTRFWYIRLVDLQTLLLTGLTRDGTFYIEDGKIKYPVKNFRFNESPAIMLSNAEELGIAERCENMIVPPMKIRDFTFTSLSDAV